MGTIKRIPAGSLKIGMYVNGLDCPWYKSPFLRHRFLVRSRSQLDKLMRYGIREVIIDTSRGLDFDTPEPAVAPADCEIPAPIIDPSPGDRSPSSFQAMAQDLQVAREARERLAQSVRTVFGRISSSGVVRVDEVQDVVREIIIVTRTLTNPAAFISLSRFGKFDPSLSDHALSVCTLALILGRSVGYTVIPLHHLATAALLHDVGLFQLPHRLRRGAHSLSVEEQARYDSHGRLGAVLLERHKFAPEVLRIVADHHTPPSQIASAQESPKRETAEASQVIGVVDRYHELVTGQFDAQPHPHLALSRLYQDAQMHRLNAELVSVFIKVIGVYPVYSIVELNTGERGIVTEISTQQILKPVVMIIHDSDGKPYPVPLCVDLSSDLPAASRRSIIRRLDAEEEGLRIETILSSHASPPAIHPPTTA